ncbi:hypothetical protein M430DRAFT_160763 [Amorphotheca resinae ATCC 22711]|jgi:hypothetical protein|uniref:Uncharacterized protein n=1 Tax=Amorphotheca resinae ATCC 22711 TaxID=857342 RepID=A0A2T3BEY3_AMORE|nr:hypothetical protein M430DRAFT_160763 [Amorphotheca resinae ATCC 22711]PSS27935.1 hypothetical protein M430DRAFT_160763 [Amorphotheca resinae ATCC 22711]
MGSASLLFCLGFAYRGTEWRRTDIGETKQDASTFVGSTRSTLVDATTVFRGLGADHPRSSRAWRALLITLLRLDVHDLAPQG